MNHNGNGNIPMLGGGGVPKKAGVGVIGALIHHLDEDGEYEPEAIVLNPNGQPMAIAGRQNYVTATDLVEMMRLMVREEIASALDKK